MEKRCLIVDNEDQIASIETIQRLGRQRGLTIICDEFNVGMLSRDEFFLNNRIDVDKVIKEFRNKHKGVTYHLVAFDWNLGDEVVTGVELIRKFQENKLLTNTPKILYSGLLKEEISSQLDSFFRDSTRKTQLVNWINTLIKVDVRNFVDRTVYEQEIVSQLSKIDETLDLIIEEELRKYPYIRFDNIFGSRGFKGKSFGEIADEMERNDLIRNDFKREIIQQVIAYLAEKI